MVNELIAEAEKFIEQYEAAEQSSLILVLRELLLNAVIHGNQSISERIVKCGITKLEEFKFKIEVEDEGSGFDYLNLDMELPEDPRNVRRRGYVLINALSDEIKFKSQGQQVTVTLSFKNGLEKKNPGSRWKMREGNHITAYVTIN